MKNNSKSKAKGRNPRQKSNGGGSMDPPQIETSPTFSRVLRFQNQNSTAISTPLNALDLMNACGKYSYTSSGLTIAAVAYNVKVKKIEIWAAPLSDSTGAFATASLDWHSSSAFGSGKKVSDISVSNARPLHLVSKPPRESICRFWMQDPTVQYVTITVPPGAVIDVHVNYTMPDNDIHSSTNVSFLTVGRVYYGSLDYTVGDHLQPTDLKFS
jgi:hypothetical protein